MAIIIFITTIALMMTSLIFFPKIKVSKYELNTHWIIILIGAILVLIFGNINYQELTKSIFSNNEMNPVKLVTFFISMTMLSLYLNEIGLFHKISFYILKKVKNNQFKIFTYYSILVSILTIFISNDVVILTLAPIAIYFAKNAKINPLPYVFSVLVFANIFSMILLIGNPTNIYLALNQNISFTNYLKVMLVPGLITGITSFLILLLIFRKDLKKPIDSSINEKIEIPKTELTIGLIHMVFCLVLLIVSNLISLEMWIITLLTATSLLITSFIYYKSKNKSLKPITNIIKKAPWSFIPLILGMYILVDSIKQQGIHLYLVELLSRNNETFSYGISSFLLSNVMNNLPMSMFYALVIENTSQAITLKATFATIIGANLGVLLTPFGALAGLMWYDLVKKQDIEMSLTIYFKKLFIVGVLSLITCLLVLEIII